MPVTYEEHEEEQTKRDEEKTGNYEDKSNGSTAHFSKGDSQVHLR